jgi:hypothetical protein
MATQPTEQRAPDDKSENDGDAQSKIHSPRATRRRQVGRPKSLARMRHRGAPQHVAQASHQFATFTLSPDCGPRPLMRPRDLVYWMSRRKHNSWDGSVWTVAA